VVPPAPPRPAELPPLPGVPASACGAIMPRLAHAAAPSTAQSSATRGAGGRG
jgi:hypothetical protein